MGQRDGNYQKYYKEYVPDVKNWSDREEVKDDFSRQYAGKYMATPENGGDSDEVGNEPRSEYSSSPSDQTSPVSLAASKDIPARAAVSPQIFLASRTPVQTSSRVWI